MIPTSYLLRLAYDEAWTIDRPVPAEEEPRPRGTLAQAFGQLLAASHPAAAAPGLRAARPA